MRRPASIDDQLAAGDIGGFVGGQIYYRICHLFGLAVTAQWHPGHMAAVRVGPCGHPNQSYVFGVKTGSNGVCVSSNSEKYMYTDGFRWNTEGGAFWSGSPGTYDSLWVR